MLATLCLNEMEWLPLLYEQHKDWPGMVKWVFVESADLMFKRANPHLVDGCGLSVDGTTEYLEDLCRRDERVVHIRFGLAEHPNRDQCKARARNAYTDYANNNVKPEYICALDADEFYSRESQRRHSEMIDLHATMQGFCFTQREIWRPKSIAGEPLFRYEVVGGLWKMHHCKFWRWRRGMSYDRCHVWPQLPNGLSMQRPMYRYDLRPNCPEYIHMGWACDPDTRLAKTRYYHERGEGVTDHRGNHMDCRRAAENWKPGDALPHGAQVIPYTGEIPEVFLNS
jgi:hypothetical protein